MNFNNIYSKLNGGSININTSLSNLTKLSKTKIPHNLFFSFCKSR